MLTLQQMPKAMIVFSAHHVADMVEITTNDGSCAKGSPELSRQVQELLKAANIPCRLVHSRRWDHGVTCPATIINSKYKMPCVAVSLNQSLSGAFHVKLGLALQSLRQQGVLMIGSGASFHNFGYLFAKDPTTHQIGI